MTRYYLTWLIIAGGAEWTSELRQDILAFDVQAALSFIGPQIRGSDYNSSAETHWLRTVHWLSFIMWIDQHVGS